MESEATATVTGSDSNVKSVVDQGESHRIFWQQWTADSSSSSAKGSSAQSRRSLVTSSAAVRLYHNARAVDVTQLLRRTLLQSNGGTEGDAADNLNNNNDALVLVGTLYNHGEVQFEHQLNEQSGSKPSSCDPFHVVVSLQPDDAPLVVRDRMNAQLQALQSQRQARLTTRTIISPKLQWYYVPNNIERNSNIPNCIDLDGYATSLEDEGPEPVSDEEASISSDIVVDDHECLVEQFPWLNDSSEMKNKSATSSQSHQGSFFEKKARREAQLLQLLRNSRSTQHLLSGFLWKQSRTDPHVWRKLHCVVTDDYLWFVSRLKAHGGGTNGSSRTFTYAHHGRIQLQRALLLTPSVPVTTSTSASQGPPSLWRTTAPHSWELVSAHGTSHIFRAATAKLQKRWMATIGDRILQSFENSLFQDAQLLTADECRAKNQRRHAVAVEPLLASLPPSTTADASESTVMQQQELVLRWGLQVASYRQACRYLSSQLPTQTVDAVRANENGGTNVRSVNKSSSSTLALDPLLKETVQGCWLLAEAVLEAVPILLGRLMVLLENNTNSELRRPLGGAVETQCQHVQRCLLRVEARSAPPPMDLFDVLLKELQTIVVGPSTQA